MSRGHSLGAIAAAISILAAAPAAASTFTVNTTVDDSDFNTADPFCDADPVAAGEQCTLRAALEQSNNQPGADGIVVPGGAYVIAAQLTIDAVNDDAGVTVSGAGAATTVISPEVNGRILEVRDGSSELSGVTLRGGAVASVGGGIFISDEQAGLSLRDAVVANNQAIGANGGGIWNIGTLVIERTTVSGNSTQFSGWGGGIYNDDEADLLRIVASTVSGNTVFDDPVGEAGRGGGIYIGGGPPDGSVELDRTTVSENSITGTEPGDGGGIYNEGALTLGSATLAANSAASGANLFRDDAGQLVARNTLIADPLGGGANCGGAGGAASSGHNLEDGSTCGLTGAAGDLVGVDPLLGPLAINGGPTLTRSPLGGSPAIDAGAAAPGETTDQRGLPRISDVVDVQNASDGSDIGAVEITAPPACAGRSATIVAVSRRTVGTANPDVIVGRAGKDRIKGKGGKDRICGNGGNDRIKGGSGKDTLRGGPGSDLLAGGPARDRCKGGPGKDRLSGCD